MDKFDYRIPPDERPLAFVDLETTGGNWWQHEIIEVGAVITTPELDVVHEIDTKVRPLRIEDAAPEALVYNGYTPEAWENAVDLKGVLEELREHTINAALVAHNPTFEKPFLEKAFVDNELPMHEMDYHSIDTYTLGRLALRGTNTKWYSLDAIAVAHGLEPEPKPHRAINGARLARDVYRKLMKD